MISLCVMLKVRLVQCLSIIYRKRLLVSMVNKQTMLKQTLIFQDVLTERLFKIFQYDGFNV
nr:MAG TPA: hypothetical protein [Caudoviricetes sp.]